jgi:hypothetical protein
MFKRRAKRMHTVFRFSVTTMKLANSTTSTIVHVQTLLTTISTSKFVWSHRINDEVLCTKSLHAMDTLTVNRTHSYT